jgi:hypothetical protein
MVEQQRAETRPQPARGSRDDRVHRVDTSAAELVDPSRCLARCGQRVLEIYNDGRDVTCPQCLER